MLPETVSTGIGNLTTTARFGSTIVRVAYDVDLADRIRELVATEPGLTEQRMFGGLAFLLAGNMAVAASGQGGLMVRVDPADAQRLLAASGTRRMEMNGRPMKGWLLIDVAEVHTKRQLSKWVRTGVSYTRSLPAKPDHANHG